MGITGIVKVNTAQSRAFCPTSISDAFRKIGARPYSVNQILSQCTTSIDREMESKIIRNLERLAWQIGHKGELFEEEYEDLGICDVGGNSCAKQKEDLVVCRRRTTVLTNANFVQRQRDAKDEAANKKDQDIARRKEAALKKVEAAATAQTKREAAAAKKLINQASKDSRAASKALREAAKALKVAAIAAKTAVNPPANAF